MEPQKRDRDNPQSKYIHQASDVGNQILAHIIEWRQSPEHSSRIRNDILDTLLPWLYELNDNHFGGSEELRTKLDMIDDAVRSGDPDEAWSAVLDSEDVLESE